MVLLPIIANGFGTQGFLGCVMLRKNRRDYSLIKNL